MTTAKGMKPTGILHFAIGVSDLEEGRKFYEGVLGCTYLRQNDDSVFMQAGNEYFVLTNAGKHTRPNPPGGYEFHHAFIVDGGDFDRLDWFSPGHQSPLRRVPRVQDDGVAAHFFAHQIERRLHVGRPECSHVGHFKNPF